MSVPAFTRMPAPAFEKASAPVPKNAVSTVNIGYNSFLAYDISDLRYPTNDRGEISWKELQLKAKTYTKPSDEGDCGFCAFKTEDGKVYIALYEANIAAAFSEAGYMKTKVITPLASSSGENKESKNTILKIHLCLQSATTKNASSLEAALCRYGVVREWMDRRLKNWLESDERLFAKTERTSWDVALTHTN